MTEDVPISLVELAKKLLEKAEILQRSIHSPPSFCNDTLQNLPVELEIIRRSLIDISKQFTALVRGTTGPYHRLGEVMTMTHPDQMALKFIYKFRIPQAVPLADFISFSELAEKCSVNKDRLTRILRHAMTFHVFYEPEAGVIAHTADSRLLASNPAVFDYLGAYSEDPAECGFSLAYNTDQPMYEYLKGFPEQEKRFGAAMSVIASEEGGADRHIVNYYPWDQLGNGTVVDVGGGNGHIGYIIARSHPLLSLVVQDVPDVVAVAKSHLPPELSGRVKFSAHDFFLEQPIKDADTYFFAQIMHNWSDNHWIRILRALIPALKPGARILVCDKIIPNRDTVSALANRKITAYDVMMMAFFNARERSVDDVAWLFQQADSRFKYQRTVEHDTALQIICEAIWEP